MKKIFILSILLTLAFGYAHGKDMKDLITHRDKNYKYSISYPRSWASVTTTHEATRFKIVSNNGKGEDDFSINVRYVDELKKETPKEFVDIFKANLNESTQSFKKTLLNFKIIQHDKTFISNQEAYYLIATFIYRSMGFEIPMKMIQVHTASKGFLYVVTARTTQDRFDSMLPTYKVMMTGFVIHPTVD
jgi:hypothetical protein